MNLYFRQCFNLWVIKKLYCELYCLNKFFLVTARGYWSFEIAHNSKGKRNAVKKQKNSLGAEKKSNSAKSIQVDSNYWNSWKMHFSSKPIEFWNDPKRSDVSLFWMKRRSHCPKQAYNCSNYNVSVSAGLKDNTVIIFYLYTIQVTTFTMYIIKLIISWWIVIETHSAFLQVDFHELPSVSQIPSA